MSTPAAQGVGAAGISAFLDAIESDSRIEPHGLIIQRHGHRIAEGYWAPHTAERIRLVYSLSKSFTGAALGLQIGEGRLALDDLVADHLPELFANVPAATRRMRIRHIASMATGHDRETIAEATALDPVEPDRGFLAIPPDAEPGTLFAYNQPPVLALARILQRLAGDSLVGYLRPRVLDPLGIGELRWAQTPAGFDLGYSGVYTTLDAVARLGQLHLDDGVWNGRRILPEGWVADASSVQVANPQRDEPDWQQGYGFQLWMSRHGYRGDGAFGQYMVVLPDQDVVVAMFACTEHMQAVLDAMWKHLLPAIGDGARLRSDDDDVLARRLAGSSVPTVAERRNGGPPTDVAAMTYRRATGVPSHPTVRSVEIIDDRVILHEDGSSIGVPLTRGWSEEGPTAASAARLSDGRLAVDVAFLATPHRLELELDPSDATFVARWPIVPLFGAGLGNRLASLTAPAP